MRLREAFSLYRRKPVSGRVVYYYQCYDGSGRRVCGQSTGKTNRTAAREYCDELLRLGKLVPEKEAAGQLKDDALIAAIQHKDGRSPVLSRTQGVPAIPAFAEFAEGWRDYETSAYLKKRRGRRPISRSYSPQGKYSVRARLNPAFGGRRIDTLTTFEIDAWLSSCADRGYANTTANSAFKILNVMLGGASLAGIIPANPCAPVKLLTENTGKIEILTIGEVKKMFPADRERIWDNDIYYVINKLAACTGMRFGELPGLRGEYVFDGYINVCGQVTGHRGYTDTKSHKARLIPVTKTVGDDLLRLKEQNDGYLFPFDGGVTAVRRSKVYKAYYEALRRIGIDGSERIRRNISMHGRRHFFNTELLENNVTEIKVRSITGHSSKKMTRRYAHLDATRFTEVLAVQEKLLDTNNNTR